MIYLNIGLYILGESFKNIYIYFIGSTFPLYNPRSNGEQLEFREVLASFITKSN